MSCVDKKGQDLVTEAEDTASDGCLDSLLQYQRGGRGHRTEAGMGVALTGVRVAVAVVELLFLLFFFF
jgi:hypothetical protein